MGKMTSRVNRVGIESGLPNFQINHLRLKKVAMLGIFNKLSCVQLTCTMGGPSGR